MTPLPRPGVVLFAEDLQLVTIFYEEVAGLSIVRADSDHIVLACEGLELIIHAMPEALAGTLHIEVPPEPRDEAAIKLSLPVTSLAAARSRAAKHGGAVGAEDAEWEGEGFRACDGHDPEGNVVQFREPASVAGDDAAGSRTS